MLTEQKCTLLFHFANEIEITCLISLVSKDLTKVSALMDSTQCPSIDEAVGAVVRVGSCAS